MTPPQSSGYMWMESSTKNKCNKHNRTTSLHRQSINVRNVTARSDVRSMTFTSKRDATPKLRYGTYTGFYGTFRSKYRFLWRHSLASSFLVFRVAISGLQIMKYFSFIQRLHFLVDLEYGLALANIFHFMSYCFSLSLSDHIYWLRVVEFLLVEYLKLFIWFVYLILNVFSVRPMYVSSLLVSSLLTVAW